MKIKVALPLACMYVIGVASNDVMLSSSQDVEFGKTNLAKSPSKRLSPCRRSSPAP